MQAKVTVYSMSKVKRKPRLTSALELTTSIYVGGTGSTIFKLIVSFEFDGKHRLNSLNSVTEVNCFHI